MTNLIMKRGDTLSFGVLISGLEGEELSEAYFAVRSEKAGDALVQKTLGDGISSTIEEGVYLVRLSPADTEPLKDSDYFYDLEIRVGHDTTQAPAQDRFTVMDGKLFVRDK